MDLFPFSRRVTALLLLSTGIPAWAAPAGALDPSFDDDGKQTIAFDIDSDDDDKDRDDLTEMVLAPGGRIYLVGLLRRSSIDVAIGVARLRHDGKPDLTFGAQGRIVTDVVDGQNAVLAAALQQDGKLLIAGYAKPFGEQKNSALVCRLLSTGMRDPGFGDEQTPGCRVFADTSNQFFTDVLVQPDGRIVLALKRSSIGTLLLRLESDGSEDGAFGAGGSVLLGGEFSDSGFNSIARMADGGLVAAGYTRLNAFDEEDLLLFRVDEHGIPDDGFGPFGTKVIPINAGTGPMRRRDLMRRVHARADGSLLITGSVTSDNNAQLSPGLSHTLVAVKLDQDGEPDNSFGGGIQLHDPCLTPCSSESRDSVVLPDGRLVLAGFHQDVTSGAAEFLAMRLLPNGDPDPSFGEYSAGVASIDFAMVDDSDSDDRAYGIALDGARLILAGTATVPPVGGNQGPQTDFAVVRLDHGLDQTFFNVSSESFGNGTLSPAELLSVNHSDHVDFDLVPAPGYMIGKAEGCDGALYGKVYTTGPIVADCTVTATFELKPVALFADEFEQ